VADATQNDAKIDGLARRRPPRRGLSGWAAKQPIRQPIELGCNIFENVGKPVGDSVSEPAKTAPLVSGSLSSARSRLAKLLNGVSASNLTVTSLSRVSTNPTGVVNGWSVSARYITGALR
jgi:hypothetical protein